MIRLLPALTFLLMLSSTVYGQSPIWVDAFNTSKSGSVTSTHFTIDKDGNNYHGGNFTGTALFDTFKLVATATDGYIVKTSPGGKTRWAVKLGGTNQDQVVQVATDDSNNVYVTGVFTGTFVVQGKSFTGGSFSNDSYLAKFDSSGTVVWIKIASGTSIQQATSVKVDASYNVYWYGQYFGASTVAGRSLAQAGGSYDLFLAKIAPSGKPIYVKGYGGTGAELSFDLALSGKQVYFSGRFFGTFTIGTTSVTGSGGYDVFIVRMDSSLKLSWIQKAGGSSTDDITALDVNSKGEVLFAGNFTTGFSIGSKSVSGSWNDIYVAKLNSSGTGLWVNKITGTGFTPANYVKGAHIDEDGVCMIGGYHGTTITIGTTNYSTTGGSDAFVAQYNKNGSFLWINRGGGNNNDLVYGLEVDQTGYYYIGGHYSSKTKFGANTLNGTSINNYTAKGTPPVETPNFKKLRTQYVYVDSTFEKTYDLKLKSAVTYSILRKPDGMLFDSDDATITFTPTSSDIGKHWIVLSAENLGGSDKDSFQLVVITPLKASLSLPDKGCVNQEFVFEQADQSVGPLTVIWDFGDGNSSVAEQDIYSYSTPGKYIVKMYVANALSVTDSLSDTIQIMPLPTAAFDIAVACINDTMHLVDASTISSGSIVGYQWLENGAPVGVTDELKQFRSAAGVFKYALIALSDVGCSDTIDKIVRITAKPTAGFLTYNTCEQDDALFFDVSTATNDTIVGYAWDFGDGVTEDVDYPSFSHVYAAAGTYTATLTTTTKNGCSDSYSQPVLVNEKPVAQFNLSDLCLGQELVLDDLSKTAKGTIIQRRWSTGDGKSSNKATLKHTYKIPGSYKVSLVSVNSLNCADTLTEEITVTQKAQIGFTNTFPCVGQNAIFQDTSKTGANDTKLPTKWYVDGILEPTTGDFFIKGVSTSTIKVQMVVSTLAGCYDSLEKLLVPNSPIIADFGLAPGCEGDTLLIVHSFDTSLLDTTQWIGNGIEVFEVNDQYFAHLKSFEKESKLFLRTFAKNGCQDSIANSIIVYPAPSSDFTYLVDTPSKKVVFRSLAAGSNTYTWDFDNGTAPLVTTANPVDATFNVNMDYDVNLKIESDKGCTNEVDSIIYIGFPNSIAGASNVTIALYPNPAQNYITIDMDLPEMATYSQSVIRDVAGQEVLRSSDRQIDVSSLSEGSYLISVEIDGTILTGRFVKQ